MKLTTVALLFAATIAVAGHELSDASATVIVRDGGHVELRLQVPYAEVMQRVLAPQQNPQAFLPIYANMAAVPFERAVAQVNAAIVRDTRIVVGGRSAALRAWQWPRADEVKQSLQTLVMARIVGDAHQHAVRLPVKAETMVSAGVATVQVRLPPAMGRSLVTVYHPQERWLEEGALSPSFPVTTR